MQSPPFPRCLVPPRSKYSPQHHVLKHPQLPFIPQCQRPSFAPIQSNRQKYSSIYILIFIDSICTYAFYLSTGILDFLITIFMSKILLWWHTGTWCVLHLEMGNVHVAFVRQCYIMTRIHEKVPPPWICARLTLWRLTTHIGVVPHR